MAYENLVQMIVENVGGESNISSVTHCATRLRFKLKDDSKVNKSVIEQSPDVLSVVNKGGQFQIIIGTHVSKVYEQLLKMTNIQLNTSNPEKPEENERSSGNLIGRFFNVISGIFTPLLPALAGAGVLRGILMICNQLGWISEDSGTYGILSAASLSVFYFLPILLAFTSAKRFGVNPYIAAVIGGAIMHPDFTALMGEQGNGAMSSFLGMPVILMNYSSTVIPILLAIWIYSYLERYLERVIPKSIQILFVPLISFAIIVPLTVIVFGPFGVYVGEWIAGGINYFSEANGWLTGLIVGGIWNVFVVFGLQWAVNPIMISNISTVGYDRIVPWTAAANFGTAGATFGVLLKTKNKKMRSFSTSALLSIFFAGITEPAIYGVMIKLKRPFIAAIIGGAAGGAYMGGNGVISNAFVFGGLTTIPAFAGNTLIHYLIGLLICFVVSAVVAFVLGFKDDQEVKEGTIKKDKPSNNTVASKPVLSEKGINSPINGKVIDLKDVEDGVFSEGLLGKGIAIIPSEGKVYAPADGVMTTVFPTKHAYGITTTDGAEILIHIGINTVELNGELFTSHVHPEQHVKAGDLIAEFNLEQIKAKGYPIYTPVIITNSTSFENIEPLRFGDVTHESRVLQLN
ncbi:PTS beta-glucoside transporter subunit EIIBCA [Robertmurraya siralis]|uniref:PTS beta-glucoside transporter subunit EIIBCA n=1 Tax=Robertmurraya siralis TaxID=77777 RepID=A0A919WKB2_9BACI|nr:beta-glucoside-specific PTS transporter subunit IIABC [Robertmurraya siralis]GIN63339.1 PTS beta-glucoside transporter subunit EIIBCA [Robertmurraya siralis]